MSKIKLTRSRPKVGWNSLMTSTATCCCQLHQHMMPHLQPKKPLPSDPRTEQFIFMIWWKQSFMMPRKTCLLMILMSLLAHYKLKCISRSHHLNHPGAHLLGHFPGCQGENGLSFPLKHKRFGISWMITPRVSFWHPRETTFKPGKEGQHT